MSHFTRIRISFFELSTFRHILTNQDISRETSTEVCQNATLGMVILIRQANLTNPHLVLESESCDLIADWSCWYQLWSLELFLDKINHDYSNQTFSLALKNDGFSMVQNIKPNPDSNKDSITEKWAVKL